MCFTQAFYIYQFITENYSPVPFLDQFLNKKHCCDNITTIQKTHTEEGLIIFIYKRIKAIQV
uniref:Uncharacterized protein n=1 Tax=Anguilla anguilla TaxID=7936 RepID=A0A0E9WXN8_ANGAN